MKVDIKSNESGSVAPKLSFQDKDIHKLSTKEGSRKDFKFFENLSKVAHTLVADLNLVK